MAFPPPGDEAVWKQTAEEPEVPDLQVALLKDNLVD